MRQKLIILISIIVILLFSGCFENIENSNQLTEGELILVIIPERSQYSISDQVNITIKLVNNDTHDIKVQPISFSANVIPIVLDSIGNELEGHIKTEDYSIGNKDLIKLKPNEFIKLNLDLNTFFSFEQNNTYRVWAEYTAINRYSGEELLNSWKGELISNEIEFEITS